jgi:hypothetical protein
MSGPSGRPVLAAAVSVVVVATIVAGIVTLGSPTEERARRLDERRLSDLRQLQSAVNFFHSQQKRLPESLEQLAQKRELRVGLDPATKQPYGYRRIDDGHYGLCAIFERSSPPQESSVDIRRHDAGRYCFQRTPPSPPRG